MVVEALTNVVQRVDQTFINSCTSLELLHSADTQTRSTLYRIILERDVALRGNEKNEKRQLEKELQAKKAEHERLANQLKVCKANLRTLQGDKAGLVSALTACQKQLRKTHKLLECRSTHPRVPANTRPRLVPPEMWETKPLHVTAAVVSNHRKTPTQTPRNTATIMSRTRSGECEILLSGRPHNS